MFNGFFWHLRVREKVERWCNGCIVTILMPATFFQQETRLIQDESMDVEGIFHLSEKIASDLKILIKWFFWNVFWNGSTRCPRVLTLKQKAESRKNFDQQDHQVWRLTVYIYIYIFGSCHMPDFKQIEVHLFKCFMSKPVSRKLNWDGNVCHNTSNEAKSTLATGKVCWKICWCILLLIWVKWDTAIHLTESSLLFEVSPTSQPTSQSFVLSLGWHLPVCRFA